MRYFRVFKTGDEHQQKQFFLPENTDTMKYMEIFLFIFAMQIL